jgi:decaprenylphospho-beta-D-erythro-pentofuranosid-2-ulose 2-reductase
MRNSVGGVQSLAILGGTSDIGLAVAEALIRRGCETVVLAGRIQADLDRSVERLQAAGADSVRTVLWDALDPPSHGDAIAKVFADGDIDLVLYAAGVLGSQPAFDADPVAAAEAAAANYVGAVSSLLSAASALRKQGHGTVGVLSSVAGERVRKSNFVYGSTKAALDAFAQGLGDALVGTGVRVLVVRPGFVRTKMTAGMARAPLSTTPEAVATAVVRGLARGDEIVWVPAPFRWIMAVLRHLPRPIWRRVSARM